MPERRIAIVVFPGCQALDLTGPHEVFAGANQVLQGRHRGDPRYELLVTALEPGAVRSESGLGVVADHALADLRPPLDTLLVVGGDGVHDARRDPELVAQVVRLAAGSRRVASVCTGSFVLAAAGLLDGREVCTHWARARRLAREFPLVTVDPESLYRRDGAVWTSAGVTAGVDLALALVEDDCGAEVAQTVARWMVMFLRRPGGQSQFAARAVAAGQRGRRHPGRPGRDPGRPGRGPLRARAGGRGRHEPAQLHPRVHPRAGHDPGPVRRAGPGRGRLPAAGDHRADRRRRGPPLRLRHGRDPAPVVPAHARHPTHRLPASLRARRLTEGASPCRSPPCCSTG